MLVFASRVSQLMGKCESAVYVTAMALIAVPSSDQISIVRQESVGVCYRVGSTPTCLVDVVLVEPSLAKDVNQAAFEIYGERPIGHYCYQREEWISARLTPAHRDADIRRVAKDPDCGRLPPWPTRGATSKTARWAIKPYS